ncbi:Thioredoxin-dependent 5'-adenylylsulfate reductase [Geodia barretti]|uniref:Adenosine 5'-phosphosulfate reductase n=2 Tax=Geodia barretti TaxID=519541 RepID=A0AA35TMU6_GEOBA|nr:Thioredoxin-dependent 5'-adenylylsulfate reductase [Geodia barretti]
MMIKINPRFRFFTLDTGRLPQETYDVMDAVRKRYGINLEVMFPDTDEVEEMVRKKGLNLFYESVENRRLCCGIRKVHPINRMLGTLDGWITGLRQDQTETRRDAKIFEVDTQHSNILKINPLVDWTWDRLWGYIRANDVPYNKLLDAGYPSIGCAPCTRAVEAGQDARSGRWWWEHDTHKECGLHMDYKK